MFISIIVCVYNGEKYLKECLLSIANQDYNNFEVIVYNDGSTDNSEKIILENKKLFLKFRYYKGKNKGLAYARNCAFSLAQGEYFAVIDQDDICLPSRLSDQLKVVKQTNNSAKFIFGNSKTLTNNIISSENFLDQYKFIDQNCSGKIIKNQAKSLLLKSCFVDSETWFMHREVFDNIGPLNIKLKYLCDFDYFFRVASNYDFYFTKKVVSYWRIHEDQQSVINSAAYIEPINWVINNIKLNFNFSLYIIMGLKSFFGYIKNNFIK
jgi:glycosyltransferase involved in cell wall biosynthesis